MKAFLLLLNEILIINVDVNHGVTSIQMRTAKYSWKNAEFILQEVANTDDMLLRKKLGVAVIFISGNEVGSKTYGINDDTVIKITENENLLWSIRKDGTYTTIDFIRKAFLEHLFSQLKEKDIYIADILISKYTNTAIHEKLYQLYNEKFNFKLVKKSREFGAFFFDSLFNKIKLPVLLFFFVLLFINFLVFSRIKAKYDIGETAYNTRLQNNKLRSENTKKANRLFGEYNEVETYPLSLISDRIASYMPKNMRFTFLSFFPEKKSFMNGKKDMDSKDNVIIVKGYVEVAGSVLLFTQYLQEDNLFKKVDIIYINNQPDSTMYDFELHIIL